MDNKLIKVFEKVQKIPYRVCRFEKEKINQNLKYGDCRHKSLLLKQLLEKESYEVKEIKVLFDWKDLPLPQKIISILKKSPTVWSHNSLKVKVNHKWIKVDPTWNIELEKKGFPVTKKWNGETDTKQVTEEKLKFYDKKRCTKKIMIDKEEARDFAEGLNNFLSK